MTEEQKRVAGNARAREAYAANPERARARVREWRREHKEELKLRRKPIDPKKNYARVKAWRAANPGKRSAMGRAHYAKHKGAIVVRHAAYRAANKEKIAAWHQGHYAANRAKLNEQGLRYARAHPAEHAARAAKRRATKLQATPSWSNKCLIGAIYERAHDLGLHVDHVIPLKHKLVCGLHVPFNLQLLTAEANHSKGNRFHV